MALAVQSVSSEGNWTSNNPATVTITKPSGLAVGDLMVAFIANTAAGTACDTPSGWTRIRDNGGANHSVSSFYIVATSTETAATNFTFVATGSGAGRMSGGILRITGHVAASPIDTSNGQSANVNDSTPNHTITVTPTLANSLLLYMVYIYSASTNGISVSNQAITTSNPTWTEAFDIPGASTTLGMAVAYAIRPEITATGDATSTLSIGDNTEDSDAQMVVVKPIQNVTINASVLTASSSIPTPTTKNDINLPVSVITATSSVITPTLQQQPWKNTTKSSASGWINPDKSI